jgi:hypothetical protein
MWKVAKVWMVFIMEPLWPGWSCVDLNEETSSSRLSSEIRPAVTRCVKFKERARGRNGLYLLDSLAKLRNT